MGCGELFAEVEVDNDKVNTVFEIALFFQLLLQQGYQTENWDIVKVPSEYAAPLEPKFE